MVDALMNENDNNTNTDSAIIDDDDDDDLLASQTFLSSDRRQFPGDEDDEDDEYDDGAWSSLLLSSFPTMTTTTTASSAADSTRDYNNVLRRKKKRQRQRLRRLLNKNKNKGPKVMTWRSTLLALYLFLTLGVFWLLDSIKDPILTILVDGDLHKHQPYAKMVSVIGTLLCTVAIEIISTNIRKKQKQQQQQQQQRQNDTDNDDVLSGGGTWTRMNVDISTNHIQHDTGEDDTDDDDDDDGISVQFFQWLGIVFIVVLSVFAYLISNYNDYNSNNNGGSSTAKPWLGYALYFTIESYGSLCVASFWSFANTTLTLQAAEHYYGYIIALGQLGAIVGSTIAAEFSNIKNHTSSNNNNNSNNNNDHHTSTMMPMLLIIACIGIFLSIIEMKIYTKYFPNSMTNNNTDETTMSTTSPNYNHNDKVYDHNDDLSSSSSLYVDQMKVQQQSSNNNPTSNVRFVEEDLQLFNFCCLGNNSRLKGIQFILKHSYMLYILGASCLYEISLTCLDYEMKLIGLERYGNNNNNNSINGYNTTGNNSNDWSFAQFMGRYGQWTNITSLFLSYFIFPRLMQRFGLKYTLRLFPTLLLTITLVVFLALPLNLPVLVFSMCLLKAMTYSIHDPAKEILYIPTCSEIKFRSKFWIDVVGARIAKAIGSSINVRAGSAENIVHIGVIPSVVTAIALLLVSYKVGIVFETLISNHQIIGSNKNDDQIINHYNTCNEQEQEQEEVYHFPSDTEDKNKHNNNDDGKLSSIY